MLVETRLRSFYSKITFNRMSPNSNSAPEKACVCFYFCWDFCLSVSHSFFQWMMVCVGVFVCMSACFFLCLRVSMRLHVCKYMLGQVELSYLRCLLEKELEELIFCKLLPGVCVFFLRCSHQCLLVFSRFSLELAADFFFLRRPCGTSFWVPS